jgi:hypothetical protein
MCALTGARRPRVASDSAALAEIRVSSFEFRAFRAKLSRTRAGASGVDAQIKSSELPQVSGDGVRRAAAIYSMRTKS